MISETSWLPICRYPPPEQEEQAPVAYSSVVQSSGFLIVTSLGSMAFSTFG
jgi:hypothetical protein